MRLFIYNNNQLKHVFTNKYIGQKNLFEVFGDLITESLIGTDSRKQLLWATAFRNMKTMLFDGSVSAFKNENKNGRTLNKKTADVYDFYMDRGTGWIALARNYSVYDEINNKGNVPDKSSYLSEDKPLPWADYSSKVLFVTTDGSNKVIQSLMDGESSIIPFGVGNFYGTDHAMQLDHFKAIASLANKLSATVRAVYFVEWPAALYDMAYIAWYNQKGNELTQEKASLQKQLSSGKLTAAQEKLMKAQMNQLDQNEQGLQASKPKLDETYEAFIATNELSNTNYDASGQEEFLSKLQKLDTFLTVSYREMSMMTSAYHFDSTNLDKAWYQHLYSGLLFSLGGLTQILASLAESTISGTQLPGSGKASELSKGIFSAVANYFFKEQALYNMGGAPEGVNAALKNILDLLTISYTAFELFLLDNNLVEMVTTRTRAQVSMKLEKVKKLVEAKNKNEGLPVVDEIRKRVEEYMPLDQT